MIKGTTPTHTFNLPFNVSNIAEAKITYAQDNLIKITKRTEDCELKGQQLSVSLTQEDTFEFELNPHCPVMVQLRVLTVSGDVLSTKVMNVPVGRCLDTEVLK